MIITKIRIENYKAYQHADIDLSVMPHRPIILIGGHNGDGKTTFFEAICGALYGLKLKTAEDFRIRLNNGMKQDDKSQIVLEIYFTGKVLSQDKKYQLQRTYMLNQSGQPVESVRLIFEGSSFVYGTATPPKDRIRLEAEVNKVIKANLPEDLSSYFLFDAMKSSELMDKAGMAQVINKNFESVMGFKKYRQLKEAAGKLVQQETEKRIIAEQQRKEYSESCQKLEEVEMQIEDVRQRIIQGSGMLMKRAKEYEDAKRGADNISAYRRAASEAEDKIKRTCGRMKEYIGQAKEYADNIDFGVFIPKVLSDLRIELDALFRAKETNGGTGGMTDEALHEVVGRVLDYMKEEKLYSGNVTVEEVCRAIKDGRQEAEVYPEIEKEEVEAIKKLVAQGGNNTYAMMANMRDDVQYDIDNLPGLRREKEGYESKIEGGSEAVIRDYERERDNVERLKEEEKRLLEEAEKLRNRTISFEEQITSGEDRTYDTLAKLPDLMARISDRLLARKREQIEHQIKVLLNELLASYQGVIGKVELTNIHSDFAIRLFHKNGNEISLEMLNAASKQIFIQVLLKVLRDMGDYNPPVMIDTVMGVLDNESRETLMEHYFPHLAEQTILLSTTSEVTKEKDYKKLKAFISRTYTLTRDVEGQYSTVETGYFGIPQDDLKRED